jgi:CO/xanthine dehydrogenase Mo-binding subunit
MDYALPSAQQLPSVEVVEAGSPSPLNPLGTKGAGESGCMGAPAAIAAALEDALQPLGIHVDELPMTHDQLFQVLAAAGRS